MDAKTTQLKDLDVERIDGVDRPATGRKFLLMKNEGGAQAVLKQAAAASFAASAVLKCMREDAGSTTLAKSTLIAANGLAQVLGQEAVSKAVPTQPYEYSEPDVDVRGPADEKLGSTAALTMKAEAVEAAKAEAPKPKAEEKEDEKEMPWMKAAKAQSEQIASLTSAIAKQGEQISEIVKIAKGELEGVTKAETKPAKPASKQVVAEDKKEVVEKSDRVSFASVVFAK